MENNLRAKVCVIHEEDNDIHRLRFHPTKTIMMKIGFVFFPYFNSQKIISMNIHYFSRFTKLNYFTFFRQKNHLGILNPDEPKKDVNVEMHEKMNPKDFQNNVYACCGLMELKKWGVEHNRCYGG